MGLWMPAQALRHHREAAGPQGGIQVRRSYRLVVHHFKREHEVFFALQCGRERVQTGRKGRIVRIDIGSRVRPPWAR